MIFEISNKTQPKSDLNRTEPKRTGTNTILITIYIYYCYNKRGFAVTITFSLNQNLTLMFI
jgi:hypothetical protein